MVANANPGAPPQRQAPPPDTPGPPRFKRLLPPGEPATAEEAVEHLADRQWSEAALAAAERPHLMLNMVSAVDGRASIAGRSGGLGGTADRELFHELRNVVDAVLVGAATVRVERYGRIIPEESRRRQRAERGLCEEPLACIVSGRLSLPADIPLLADPDARVVIVTASEASLPESAARVEYVRKPRDGLLDLPAALGELYERFHVRTLLCEGGPHLNGQLLACGLVHELFLSVAPKLVGGEEMTGEPLRILEGTSFEHPVDLRLLAVLESEDHLFLRYGVPASAPERAS